jgi:glyoxylase-like metal-dependent hydrolase (beta-lactamase superfamily II)
MDKVSDHLYLHTGAVRAGILVADRSALIIDYGDGTVEASLTALGVADVERILLTHHHRDQASGVYARASNGARIVVPEDERMWFENAPSFWTDPRRRWHLYDDHPHPPMLLEPLSVHETVAHGSSFRWGAACIEALGTPGHTDGSVSYVVEVDGKRVLFCGDLLCGDGQLADVYSLQKKGETSTDYHGFLGARMQLAESLERVRGARPDLVVPSHGPVVLDPQRAAATLMDRLTACYDRYVAVSALRYYFPAMFREFEGRRGHMPIGEGLPVPPFLRHIGTTWAILSQGGEAFVMDCGSEHVLRELERLIAGGDVSRMSELWITHYHDDHVDAVPQFQARHDVVTRTAAVVADVVEQPTAYRIPCISPSVARVDHRTRDGESWRWNEFQMTAYHFPGQTYYHAGLLVEGRGVRMFFSGDSFTPAGIDDYCAGNRNLLGAGVGYDRCLALLETLRPTHIFNCHVDRAFAYTGEQIRWMRGNLAEREALYGELIAHDHPNYGLDPHWARCHPYEQAVSAGASATLRVEFTNHSSEAREVVCEPVLPSRWRATVAPQCAVVAAKGEGSVVFRLPVPRDVAPQRAVIPVDITYGGRRLGQFREAILVVEEGRNDRPS